MSLLESHMHHRRRNGSPKKWREAKFGDFLFFLNICFNCLETPKDSRKKCSVQLELVREFTKFVGSVKNVQYLTVSDGILMLYCKTDENK
jgi:hypothetical protein